MVVGPVIVGATFVAVTVRGNVMVASGDTPFVAVSTTGYEPAVRPAAISSTCVVLFQVIAALPPVFETVGDGVPVAV